MIHGDKFPSQIGPLTRGEVKLLQEMSQKAGPDEAFTLHSALKYKGPIRPDSSGFHAAASRVANVERANLESKSLILLGLAAPGLPVMFAMGLAGFALAPVLTAAAPFAAIGVAAIALKGAAGAIATKIAERRLQAAAADTAISPVQPTFPRPKA